jgi:hypothetical protein
VLLKVGGDGVTVAKTKNQQMTAIFVELLDPHLDLFHSDRGDDPHSRRSTACLVFELNAHPNQLHYQIQAENGRSRSLVDILSDLISGCFNRRFSSRADAPHKPFHIAGVISTSLRFISPLLFLP